eukprot:221714_1
MSSWFLLNVQQDTPFWSRLDDNSSNYIASQYEKDIPTQIRPFHVPLQSANTMIRIRLLPNVNIPMAIECNKHYPLIYIKDKYAQNDIFGYNIEEQSVEEEKKDTNNKDINVSLIAQKIMFLNQKRMNVSNTNDQNVYVWYCLGIGDIKNVWYPFNKSLNQQIDKYFEKKQESFELNDGSIVWDVCFGLDAFFVPIPFGFIKDDKNEALIIKYNFDFFGFINGLNVALYPFMYSSKSKDVDTVSIEKRSIETQNDCILFCNILYYIFDEQQEINTYNELKKIIINLNFDGILLNKLIRFEQKTFVNKICKEFKLLKRGPASKFKKHLLQNINLKYIYSYNYYEILDIISA